MKKLLLDLILFIAIVTFYRKVLMIYDELDTKMIWKDIRNTPRKNNH